MFKFVHAADLHLDSPFRGLAAQSESVADALRSATFDAFESLIELCIEQEVHFLLIAGDVYDGADRNLRAQLRFRDGLARLAQRGIRSFVVHGNHDPLDGWSATIDWPTGVHIFGDQMETVTVELENSPVAAVSGISYQSRWEDRNLARLFHAGRPDLFQIGLLHCNCGDNTGHENYAPCQPEDLARVGLDYWALGHVHTRSILNTKPDIVYPGNTQGRNIREPGERGCYLVTADRQGTAELEFHPLDAVRWLSSEVQIDGLATIDALDRAVLAAIEDLRAQGTGRSVVGRITLTGRGPLYKELNHNDAVTDLQDRVREVGLADNPFVWVQGIELNVRPELDLDRRRQMTDLLGQALQVARQIDESEDLREAVVPALTGLYDHARVSKVLEPLSDAELKRLLEEAELLCVDMLEDQE